jgi:membrane protein DedA with SNARE-associated domain
MFLLLLACGFGLPLPEDITLLTGGILASRNITDLLITNVVCFTGILLGDGVVYMLGRRFGPVLKSRGIFKRLINEQRDLKVAAVFRKYGDKVIFMARFMPGLRMPIFMTAGIYQVKAWKFFLLDGFAAMISVPVWIYLGFIFGENIEQLHRVARRFNFAIYGVVAFIVVSFIILVVWRKWREASLASAD